jgi:hypothetical protein
MRNFVSWINRNPGVCVSGVCSVGLAFLGFFLYSLDSRIEVVSGTTRTLSEAMSRTAAIVDERTMVDGQSIAVVMAAVDQKLTHQSQMVGSMQGHLTDKDGLIAKVNGHDATVKAMQNWQTTFASVLDNSPQRQSSGQQMTAALASMGTQMTQVDTTAKSALAQAELACREQAWKASRELGGLTRLSGLATERTVAAVALLETYGWGTLARWGYACKGHYVFSLRGDTLAPEGQRALKDIAEDISAQLVDPPREFVPLNDAPNVPARGNQP